MKAKLQIKSAEEYMACFAGFFRGRGIAFVSALVTALLSYHLLIISGHGNPDAVCEGLVCYGG